MKLKRAELAIIAITIAFVCFTGGFFVGRGRSVSVVSVAPAQLAPAEGSGAAPAAPSLQSGTPGGEAPETLDLNSAPAEKLAQLPGIGEVLAARIVQYREEHGAFSSVSDVMNVSGIGEAKYLAIKDHLTCEGQN